MQHVVVSFAIFFTFSISAGHILDWEDKARRHDVVITAIVFLYLAVVFNLLLIKRHNEKRRKLEACEVIIWGTKVLTHVRQYYVPVISFVLPIINLSPFGYVLFRAADVVVDLGRHWDNVSIFSYRGVLHSP